MKSLLLTLLLISSSAFAAGSFNCEQVDQSNKGAISIAAGTSHAVGNPLFTGLTVYYKDQVQGMINRDRIVGYWNEGKELKIQAVDEDALDVVLRIVVANISENSDGIGTLNLNFKTPYGKTITRKNVKVRCFTGE